MPHDPVISVSHLGKRYRRTVAVDDVSLEVLEGEIFGLIGPNGAGKTTTTECVQGHRVPDRAPFPCSASIPAATPGRSANGSACSTRRRSSKSASRSVKLWISGVALLPRRQRGRGLGTPRTRRQAQRLVHDALRRPERVGRIGLGRTLGQRGGAARALPDVLRALDESISLGVRQVDATLTSAGSRFLR